MIKITIPSPCHENWNEMLPNQQGRHCNSCSKTVIDFTEMTDDEVKDFLISKEQERLCGRFSSSQLQQIRIELPRNIFEMNLPLWKQFLVASLLVFSTTLFSCDANTQGKIMLPAKISMTGMMVFDPDTIPAQKTMGAPPLPKQGMITIIPDSLPATESKKPLQQTYTGRKVAGEVAAVSSNNDCLSVGNIMKGEVRMIPVNDSMFKKENESVIMGKMIAKPVANKVKQGG